MKSIYLHEDDRDPVIKLLEKDAGKLEYVTDSEHYFTGRKGTPMSYLSRGHSRGSIILRYENYLSSPVMPLNRLYRLVRTPHLEEYITSVEHLFWKKMRRW
ncbi:MAG: hypothetical protein MZV63_32900 [Marinilabiliales bacterium]|nr:hypothetical protein [Marinilabiliales bacterium]